VPLVFAGNRKLANVWTQRFFEAALAARRQSLGDLVREPLLDLEAGVSGGGTDARVRRAALEELPDGFPLTALRAVAPEVGDQRLRRVLGQLRKEGRLRCEGRGPGARWWRTPS
jgi:hypothetical protein